MFKNAPFLLKHFQFGLNPEANKKVCILFLAARKAQKQNSAEDKSELKTFEGGFFSVQSPVRTPVSPLIVTPKPKYSMLKDVVSSEAKKASANKVIVCIINYKLGLYNIISSILSKLFKIIYYINYYHMKCINT